MENLVQVFANSEFGKLRTIIEGVAVLFVAGDAAKMLGYARPNDAVNAHCRYTVKRSIPHPQGKGTLEVNVISEGKLPTAKKFKRWVTNNVNRFYSIGAVF